MPNPGDSCAPTYFRDYSKGVAFLHNDHGGRYWTCLRKGDGWVLGDRVEPREGPAYVAQAVSYMVQQRLLPDSAKSELDRYIDYGILPGSFLTAVLANDLAGAFGAADDDNKPLIPVYVAVLTHSVPRSAWGSRKAVREWRGKKRTVQPLEFGSDACQPGCPPHEWQIWPETDGQEQRCMKCGTYRKTVIRHSGLIG